MSDSKRTGRPPKPEGEKFVRLTLSLPPALAERIEETRAALSRSAFATQAIEKEFTMPLTVSAARRLFFAEMSNRVVNKWILMPMGGPLDAPQGYTALQKAVFDACLEVAERVRTDCAAVANDIELDGSLVTPPRSKETALATEWAGRVLTHVQAHGLGALHEEVERALKETAVFMRDLAIRLGQQQGWHQYERAVLNAILRGTRYEVLALVGD